MILGSPFANENDWECLKSGGFAHGKAAALCREMDNEIVTVFRYVSVTVVEGRPLATEREMFKDELVVSLAAGGSYASAAIAGSRRGWVIFRMREGETAPP